MVDIHIFLSHRGLHASDVVEATAIAAANVERRFSSSISFQAQVLSPFIMPALVIPFTVPSGLHLALIEDTPLFSFRSD
jgi:hypothetical protein